MCKPCFRWVARRPAQGAPDQSSSNEIAAVRAPGVPCRWVGRRPEKPIPDHHLERRRAWEARAKEPRHTQSIPYVPTRRRKAEASPQPAPIHNLPRTPTTRLEPLRFSIIARPSPVPHPLPPKPRHRLGSFGGLALLGRQAAERGDHLSKGRPLGRVARPAGAHQVG